MYTLCADSILEVALSGFNRAMASANAGFRVSSIIFWTAFESTLTAGVKLSSAV
jgi:hypothetical protein